MADKSLETKVAGLESDMTNVKRSLTGIENSITELASNIQQKTQTNWAAMGVVVAVAVAFLSMVGYLALDPTRQAILQLNEKFERHTSLDGHGVARAKLEALASSYMRSREDLFKQDEQLQGEMKTLVTAIQKEFQARLDKQDKFLQMEMRLVTDLAEKGSVGRHNKQAAQIKALEREVFKRKK